MGDARVTLRYNELAQFGLSADMRQWLDAYGKERAAVAAGQAPKDTGAGAASIHGEMSIVDGTWAVRISWDRDHYYMVYHEVEAASKQLGARPFLVPSVK